MELVATPGAANANSFTTREFANSYHEGRLHTATWTTATDADKDVALVMATTILSTRVRWKGAPTTSTQALPFPRTGLVNRNGVPVPDNVVPVELQQATAELARLLLATDRTAENEIAASGLKSLKAGPVSLAFREDLQTTPTRMVPDYVRALLVPSWYEWIDFELPTDEIILEVM